MGRRRAEIPDMGISGTGQQRIAAHLVARPFANDGAADIADIVGVEAKDGAKIRFRQRLLGPPQAIIMQASEIYPLFEIDGAMAGRGDRAVLVETGIDVLSLHHGGFGLSNIHRQFLLGTDFIKTLACPRQLLASLSIVNNSSSISPSRSSSVRLMSGTKSGLAR